MADIDFSWMEDLLTGDDADYSSLFDDVTDLTPSMPDTGIGAFDFSDLFNDDEDYSYLFDDVTDLDFDYDLGVDFSDVYDNLFNEDTNYDDTVKELYPSLFDPFKGSIEEPNWLDTILGFVGGKEGKNKAQGIMGGVGDVVNSPLGQMALLNYLKNQREQDIKIPIGQEAYGGGQGLGSMPDYRIFNLQPALMPGVGYANAPPPEMKHGGIASLDQGPGDITLARLEPGEFVMTRKATDNIGAKNLYRLMKEAERMG